MRRAVIAMSAALIIMLSPLTAFSAAAETPVYRVGYVQDRAPVSFTGENGELAGVSRFIFDRLAELTGLRFEYVPLPGGDVSYEYLMSQELDLVTSVELNRENENARGILISKPYFSSRKVVVGRQGLNFSIDAPLSVAISSGSRTIRTVLGQTFPNFTILDYDTITDCFDAVRSGKADLLIQNQYVVEYWFSKPAYEELKVIPVVGMDEKLCFSAVYSFDGREGPTYEEGEELIRRINEGIEQLTVDEVDSYTIQSVMEYQYDLTFSDFLYRYRAAVIVLALSAVIILALAVLLQWQYVRSIEARADARAKGRFLSTMSHEIRTPLNGLIGLNYLIGQRLDDKERAETYLRQSSATARYLLALVNDMLDVSKLQEHRMELSSRPVDLGLLLGAAQSIVRRDMEDRSIRFEANIDLPHPCVLGDEVRIEQVVMNLLDNARKFTPDGGSVTLTASQSDGEGEVLTKITVADTGRGMSEEFQKRAFEPFAQERETVSKGNQGTGLGLSICHDLARAMGGDLTLVSRKGEGSMFTFTFPGAPVELPEENDAPEERRTADAPLRILVAEDNELNREIMTELLTGEGYEVETAENGLEALEKFRASPVNRIGVILMDVLMPEMDGCQSARAIRELDRPDAETVRIIACTANTAPEDQERAFDAGMNDFIPKPVDIVSLLDKLGAD